MGPTETRSRDEWLAEVKRRGGRLRRRRQVTMALGAALALVLPVSALATFLGRPDGDVRQFVAGPPPSRPGAADVEADSPVDAPSQPAIAAGPATTTTTEPQLRVEAGSNRTQPPTAGSVAPADDPVVRPPVTTALAAITSSPVQASPPSTTIPPAPCVAAEFKLTLSTDKSSYQPGEIVSGSSKLEKRSPGTCLMPDWWVGIRLMNGAGRDVTDSVGRSTNFSELSQAKKWDPCGSSDCARPVEPGLVYENLFSWDLTDCTGPPPPIVPVPSDGSNCVPFPPGAYSVVADWVGPGSGQPARTTFQFGG